MAAEYAPTQLTAKDRVRRLMGDTAAPFDFQDEEIAAELTRSGFVGDPMAELPQEVAPELLASINLIESFPGYAGTETSVRQGSVSRTTKGRNYGTTLASLWRRYNALNGAILGVGAGIVVSIPDYPGLDPRNGYPSYGE